MRFLFTLHNFYPEPVYGAEKVCIQQMRELLRRGHKVGLFYDAPSQVTREELAGHGLDGLVLFRNRSVALRAQVLLSVWKPRVTRHFQKAVESFRPGAIIFHHLVRLSLDLPSVGRRRRIPTVYYLHDYYPVCPSYSLYDYRGMNCEGGSPTRCSRCLFAARFGSLAKGPMWVAGIPFLWLRERLRNRLRRDVDLFVSPSEFLLKSLERLGFPMEHTAVIPYGADQVNKNRKPFASGSVRFGYIGSTHLKKGLQVLVKAFEGDLSKHLLLRGFPDEKAIENFRNSHPGFEARLEVFNPDLDSFYDKIDVVVVPSLWRENQPNVIIESFTRGKAVVCSNLGGMAEMVEDGRSGLLFKAGDPHDLRQKIEYLAQNPSRVGALAAHAPLWPTVEENVDRLLDAVEALRVRPRP